MRPHSASLSTDSCSFSRTADILTRKSSRYHVNKSSPRLSVKGLHIIPNRERIENAVNDETQRMPDVGYTDNNGQTTAKVGGIATQGNDSDEARQKQACESTRPGEQYAELADTTSIRQQRQRESIKQGSTEKNGYRKASKFVDVRINREWPTEPPICRVVDGLASRMEQLTCLGNGQVPRVAATAFNILKERI